VTYHFSKRLEASFDDAVARTKAALAERGFGVLSEIDVAATLKAKLNVDMPAYRILGACNPGFAHRALQAEPLIGTMLPCNVIVRAVGENAVEVSAVDPVASMQAIENESLAATAREVQALLREAVESL
jgi:uncharacterized protein (DUF302 family)